MIICTDIGNSNIVYGCFDSGSLVLCARAATDSRRTSEQYAVELRGILLLHGISINKVSGAIISSVVPGITASIAQAIQTVFGTEPTVLCPSTKTGLVNKLDNPREIGGDFVASSVGAKAKYKLPAIIVDMGTATKVTALDSEGAFLGGAIMPGLRIATDALVEKTSLLPGVSFYVPPSVIGANTSDAMMSGTVYGTASMIDGLCERMSAELGGAASFIMTGGLAFTVAPICKTPFVCDDTLILDGLREIYEINRGA